MFAKIRGLKLYCVDPWIPYPRYVEMCDQQGIDEYNGAFEAAKTRLSGKNVEFIRKFSMDAVKDFEDNSLDFVYIDGNHSFEYAIADIAEWERKVKPGGIVAGHDYWNSVTVDPNHFKHHLLGVDKHEPLGIEKMKLCQVQDAIEAWTKTNYIKPWFITKPEERNRAGGSWFYVKLRPLKG
jgi:SAM-dependent methyltransferase